MQHGSQKRHQRTEALEGGRLAVSPCANTQSANADRLSCTMVWGGKFSGGVLPL
jgi:hypothetical protein